MREPTQFPDSLRLVGLVVTVNSNHHVMTSLFPYIHAITSCTAVRVVVAIPRLVLDIVSNASIYRNIKLSINRNIERVLPFHPLPGALRVVCNCNSKSMTSPFPFPLFVYKL